MMKHVNKVLVGKAATATSIDLINVGEIAVFDKNGVYFPPGAFSTGVEGEPFMIGIVTDKQDITLQDGTVQSMPLISFGNIIDPCQVTNEPKLVPSSNTKEEVLEIDMSGITPAAGCRYVLRILYKDIYELKSQFTKSYEVIANASDTVTTITRSLIDAVNKDLGRRVSAAIDASQTFIYLTGLPKTDNNGKNSINSYSQVNFEASVYVTDPAAYSSMPQASGAKSSISRPADPGDGNPKVIRDREREALPYKGVTNTGSFPIIAPELNVDMDAKYYTIVIEYDSCYRSNDNQYVKNTPKTDEIYIDETSDADGMWNIIKGYLGIA